MVSIVYISKRTKLVFNNFILLYDNINLVGAAKQLYLVMMVTQTAVITEACILNFCVVVFYRLKNIDVSTNRTSICSTIDILFWTSMVFLPVLQSIQVGPVRWLSRGRQWSISNCAYDDQRRVTWTTKHLKFSVMTFYPTAPSSLRIFRNFAAIWDQTFHQSLISQVCLSLSTWSHHLTSVNVPLIR